MSSSPTPTGVALHDLDRRYSSSSPSVHRDLAIATVDWYVRSRFDYEEVRGEEKEDMHQAAAARPEARNVRRANIEMDLEPSASIARGK
jgi:hypothetical protein